MRGLTALITVLAIAAAAPAVADSTFVEAAARLDGEWRSEGYVLKVDSYRAQANVDAARPFQWQHFLVKDVDGEMVTFTVGAELFQATLQAQAMRLTSTSFPGERTLRHVDPPAAAH